MFGSALFMFLLGNKHWLCVFFCWYFKEIGRKKKSFPFLALTLPSSVLIPPHPPFLFCFAVSPHSCLFKPVCSSLIVLKKINKLYQMKLQRDASLNIKLNEKNKSYKIIICVIIFVKEN